MCKGILQVLESVHDDCDTIKALLSAMELPFAPSGVTRNPKRDSVTKELASLATNAKLEDCTKLGRVDGANAPQSTALALAIRCQAHKVLVDDRGTTHSPAIGYLALTLAIHRLEWSLE